MGHWEQIGVENRKERDRRAKWPRWRRDLYRYSGVAIIAATWIGCLTLGLWVLGLL